MSDTSKTPSSESTAPDGSTSDDQNFDEPETTGDTASGGPAD
ncbi:MAG: hypothetical protein ACOH1T_10620 [Microbacteriaceae bacterium]